MVAWNSSDSMCRQFPACRKTSAARPKPGVLEKDVLPTCACLFDSGRMLACDCGPLQPQTHNNNVTDFTLTRSRTSHIPDRAATKTTIFEQDVNSAVLLSLICRRWRRRINAASGASDDRAEAGAAFDFDLLLPREGKSLTTSSQNLSFKAVTPCLFQLAYPPRRDGGAARRPASITNDVAELCRCGHRLVQRRLKLCFVVMRQR